MGFYENAKRTLFFTVLLSDLTGIIPQCHLNHSVAGQPDHCNDYGSLLKEKEGHGGAI